MERGGWEGRELVKLDKEIKYAPSDEGATGQLVRKSRRVEQEVSSR